MSEFDNASRIFNSAISNLKERDVYIFYTRNGHLQYIDDTNMELSATSSEWEKFKDFTEHTIHDQQISALLKYRGCWKLSENPITEEYLDFSWVGSDISIEPKYAKFKDELWDTLDIDEQKALVKMFVDKMRDINSRINDVKNITVDNFEKFSGTSLNIHILNKSRIGNKLTQLTRYAGYKTMLYNLFRSTAGRNKDRTSKANTIIPFSFEINTQNGNYMQDIKDGIHEYNTKRKVGNDKTIWVVRPSYGSRGVGMRFVDEDTMLQNFEKWSMETYKFQNEMRVFEDWTFSVFIRSFLWKLKTDKPKSRKVLVDDGMWDKVPIVAPDAEPSNFGSTRVYKPDMVNNIMIERSMNYIPMKSPNISKKFKTYKYNDVDGRINKGRMWFAVDVYRDDDGNTKYKLIFWKKLFFELCPVEFNGDDPYSNKFKLWTDLGIKFFSELGDDDEDIKEMKYVENPKTGKREMLGFNFDDVNADRANILDLCYIVDWDTGEFEFDGKKLSMDNHGINWETVKENFRTVCYIFMQATRNNIHCLSSPMDLTYEEFSWGCFQFFGMDFIIDAQSNVWLLEFNTRPWIGYSNWWRQNFDPELVHLNDKWLFLESFLRRVVDTKISNPEKIRRLPLGNDISKYDHWDTMRTPNDNIRTINNNLLIFDHSNLEDDIVIGSKTIPVKHLPNWVMTRSLKQAFRKNGWDMFPYASLIKNPRLILQGMTPLLSYLTSQTDYDEETIKSVYPHLLRANIVNRIFPLIVYLGNKAEMVRRLKASFPDDWFNVVPFTITFKKKEDVKWKTTIKEELEMVNVKNNTVTKWIAKPSLGLQGEGIFISDNIDAIISHIDRSKDDEWVVSYYIDPPLLVKDRKNHIRTFVLVHRSRSSINVYKMKIDLIFLAGYPYHKDYETFEDFELKAGVNIDDIQSYKNLTNLAKANDFFRKYTVDKSKKGNRFDDKAFIYGLMSGDAKKMIDTEYGNGFYESKMESQIKEIISKTMQSIAEEVTCIQEGQPQFESCYHYLAFDIMFDSVDTNNPKAWLLEVNVNPGLKAPTKIRQIGLENFMSSVLQLSVPDKYVNTREITYTDNNGKAHTGTYYVDNKNYRLTDKQLVEKAKRGTLKKYMDPNRLFSQIKTLEFRPKEKMRRIVRDTHLTRLMADYSDAVSTIADGNGFNDPGSPGNAGVGGIQRAKITGIEGYDPDTFQQQYYNNSLGSGNGSGVPGAEFQIRNIMNSGMNNSDKNVDSDMGSFSWNMNSNPYFRSSDNLMKNLNNSTKQLVDSYGLDEMGRTRFPDSDTINYYLRTLSESRRDPVDDILSSENPYIRQLMGATGVSREAIPSPFKGRSGRGMNNLLRRILIPSGLGGMNSLLGGLDGRLGGRLGGRRSGGYMDIFGDDDYDYYGNIFSRVDIMKIKLLANGYNRNRRRNSRRRKKGRRKCGSKCLCAGYKEDLLDFILEKLGYEDTFDNKTEKCLAINLAIERDYIDLDVPGLEVPDRIMNKLDDDDDEYLLDEFDGLSDSWSELYDSVF